MHLELERAIEVLARTPKTLSALMTGLSDDWILADEGRDTFSPKDVLGHLVSGEEKDWLARTTIILRHGPERTFDTFDRFAFRELHGTRSVDELLELFRTLRERNLDELKGLAIGPDELALEGTHPQFGRVTLSQLLAAWVVHDLGHIRQIVRVMSKQYRDAVGPWREFLPILDS